MSTVPHPTSDRMSVHELCTMMNTLPSVKEELARLRTVSAFMRSALKQIGAVCADNVHAARPDLALKFVAEIVAKAEASS